MASSKRPLTVIWFVVVWLMVSGQDFPKIQVGGLVIETVQTGTATSSTSDSSSSPTSTSSTGSSTSSSPSSSTSSAASGGEINTPTGNGGVISVSTLSSVPSGSPADTSSSSVSSSTSTIAGSVSTTELTNVTSNSTTSESATSTSSMAQTAVPVETVSPKFGDFNCASFEPGYYGNPKVACDTKFYICVDRSLYAYEEYCPGRLYFDPETKNCDRWSNIPACTGRTRPPVVVINETRATLSPLPPVIDCHNLTSGNYPDPESKPKPFCSNRFFTCGGGREFAFRCPRGLFYDHERNQCDLYARVFACSGNRPSNDSVPVGPTWPPANFDCRGKPDGYYVEKCESTYYNCYGGYARAFTCPAGLVFDSVWQSCEAPGNTLICTGTPRPSTQKPPSTIPTTPQSTTPSPLNCVGRRDGIYRDPVVNCSRFFYYCSHNDSYRNICPGNLYYDNEFQRCDLWVNVFDCSGIRPTASIPRSTTTPRSYPVLDFDCTKLDDGNYVNPNNSCSNFFYICSNMDTFQRFCPAGLYYDASRDTCDAWANIFACSGVTPKPTLSTINFTGPTQIPEFDCSQRDDGIYFNASNGCSHIYYRCSASNTFKFTCPAGLYYDITIDACDIFENVFACSGKTRPPPTVSTSTTSGPSTRQPPVDCRVLADGEYADVSAKNSCSHFFYTCSAGVALQRECADGTYYDPELRVCDSFWKVPACTGQERPKTTTAPPTTPHSPTTPPPFDCTRRFDGNYADGNCTARFWSCIGGMTFPRMCSVGHVYDQEFDTCEFPNLMPACGGQRPTAPVTVITSPTTPVGGFSCLFLADGNYGDPAAADKCSSIYYTCSNGITSRVHCPGDLYYDIANDLCNSHDLVPACVGRLPSTSGSVSMSTSSPSSSSGSVSMSTSSPSSSSSSSSTSSASSSTSESSASSSSTSAGTSSSTSPESTSTISSSTTERSTVSSTSSESPSTSPSSTGEISSSSSIIPTEASISNSSTSIVAESSTPNASTSESSTGSSSPVIPESTTSSGFNTSSSSVSSSPVSESTISGSFGGAETSTLSNGSNSIPESSSSTGASSTTESSTSSSTSPSTTSESSTPSSTSASPNEISSSSSSTSASTSESSTSSSTSASTSESSTSSSTSASTSESSTSSSTSVSTSESSSSSSTSLSTSTPSTTESSTTSPTTSESSTLSTTPTPAPSTTTPGLRTTRTSIIHEFITRVVHF